MSTDNHMEKVSVNISSSVLSNIDLLVDNGYYSNRSDFINNALRTALDKHDSTLERIIERESEDRKRTRDPWFIGVYCVSKKDLEQAVENGQKMVITGYGVLTFGDGADDTLIMKAVEAISVKGRVRCSQAVKEHFGLN